MSPAPTQEFLDLQEALVGRYSVQREIGRGGMGIVYLAHDVSLDRSVALKLLPPDMAARPSLRDRFLREARTAAKLSHPNIVPIHAVEEVGDFVFYVMSYVEGETLKDRVKNRGPLPPSEAARVLREVAWALAYAHTHGVVHRDVKADNVLLDDETGRAMVMDFGIAQLTEGEGLTDVGEVLGTAEFMSPEQASGEAVDERTDVYSMGVLGHYVLTGALPFQGTTVAATLAQHLTQPPPVLTEVAPHVPASLSTILHRCLAKDRQDRYDNGERLAEELSRTLEERTTAAVPVRSFLEQTEERLKGIEIWLFMVAYTMVIAVVLAVSGVPVGAVLAAVFSVAMAAAPLGLLARMTRALLRSGFDRGDVIRALEAKLAARREEHSFELQVERTWVDRLGRWLVLGGTTGMALGTVAATILDLSALPYAWTLGLGLGTFAGFLATITGIPVAALGVARQKRLPGQRWLDFWRSRVGGWLFGASGLRLGAVEVAAAGYRPTEMLIGTAADRLFETLPKALQRDLGELPDVIERLEGDASRMRHHVEGLERLLDQVDQERSDTGADERARLRADLERARDAAKGRMSEAVSALETIRLGLLRLHAGEGSVERVTQALGSAQDVSEQIERLIAGNQEVERLLAPDDGKDQQ